LQIANIKKLSDVWFMIK